MAWNSGALGAEIACEVEKTVRIHRAAACLTAPPSADTVTNREKGRLKFLYPILCFQLTTIEKTVSGRYTGRLRGSAVVTALGELSFFIWVRLHFAGGIPYSRLKARLKAVSV